MSKLKKNDEVIIIAGKDKGKISSIEQVLGTKVIVEGVNIAKKHVKANPNAGVAGGIVDKNMPLASSNIAILNPETKKADKIGLRFNEDNKKERFYKSTGKTIV